MAQLFLNRQEAGRKLGESYRGPNGNAIVMGIPRGGIAVGYFLAKHLSATLDALVVRKLPLPENPEIGFGAIAPDGSIVINEDIVRRLNLSQNTIARIASSVLEEIHRRENAYRDDRPFPDLEGMNVILSDDGLATGYTMIAAIKMARDNGAETVSAAVPVGPQDTAIRIKGLVDYFLCLHSSDRYPFAVATFYQDFHDMSDEEVIDYLKAASAKG